MSYLDQVSRSREGQVRILSSFRHSMVTPPVLNHLHMGIDWSRIERVGRRGHHTFSLVFCGGAPHRTAHRIWYLLSRFALRMKLDYANSGLQLPEELVLLYGTSSVLQKPHLVL